MTTPQSTNNPLADLSAAGVSRWLDDLSRQRLQSGNLKRGRASTWTTSSGFSSPKVSRSSNKPGTSSCSRSAKNWPQKSSRPGGADPKTVSAPPGGPPVRQEREGRIIGCRFGVRPGRCASGPGRARRPGRCGGSARRWSGARRAGSVLRQCGCQPARPRHAGSAAIAWVSSSESAKALGSPTFMTGIETFRGASRLVTAHFRKSRARLGDRGGGHSIPASVR